jgi:hypothetical protein
MVHFEWLAAVSANPFGVMLFFISVACAVTAFVGLIRGLPVMETLERFQADKIAMLLAVCSLLVWGVRVGTLIGSP